MLLLTNKLKTANIIHSNSIEGLIKEVCCVTDNDYIDDNCLSRTCVTCKHKLVKFLDYNKNELIEYEKWGVKKVEVLIKGKPKICQRTVKEKIECSKEELVQQLLTVMPKFLIHTRNINHQYKSVNYIKQNLSPNEVFIHMDFSENYTCKYATEIQSAHFGGSKPQISIHTVVFYYSDVIKSKVINVSICTLSENLRHDPPAICAHLDPVIIEIHKLIPDLKSVHFLSDGPNTQYKNKTMFYLMVTYLSEKMGVEVLHWHYSESGHGKGAPDGLGATVKRTADSLVGYGRDIPNFETLMTELTQKKLKVKCIPIFSSEIEDIDKLLPSTIKPFKETMSIRELAWIRSKKEVLQARELTCLKCGTNRCSHYGIGDVDFTYLLDQDIPLEIALTPKTSTSHFRKRKIQYSDVYSDSDSNDNFENNSSVLNTSPMEEKINTRMKIA